MESKNQTELTLKDIKSLYQKEDSSFDFSLPTLRTFLTKKMNYKFGIPQIVSTNISSDRFIAMRMIFLSSVMKFIVCEREIIFFDECTFSNTKRNLRCWFKKGNENRIKTNGKIKKYNLLLAVTRNEVIHQEIRINNTNERAVFEFFKSMAQKLKESPKLKHILDRGNVVVLLDNASYHKTHALKEFCIENNITLLLNVPYYPCFNMIEQVFAYLKKDFYRTVFNER